jgi:lysozyme family protein
VISDSIKTILLEVLEREGWPAYTEHPNDRGGPTKGGITIRTLEQWRQRRCTRLELKRLPEDEAIRILFRRFVEVQGISRLTNAPLQEQVIDNAILSGPSLAVKDLQRVVKVKDDGIIGSITLGAIDNFENITEVCNQLATTRALRLARFVKKNPDQMIFLIGWLTRALSFVR